MIAMATHQSIRKPPKGVDHKIRVSQQHQAVDKMFWLEPGPLTVSTRNVVWLCRPKMSFMRTIAGQSDDLRSTQTLTVRADPVTSGFIASFGPTHLYDTGCA